MDVETRIARLERSARGWKVLCLSQFLLFGFLAVTYAYKPSSIVKADDGILRGKGLIITDSQGRARVLVGAPLPEIKDRLRRDPGYAAMVFLDEQGHDRISLGQELPPQVNGSVPADKHRIAAGYGFLIDDPKGNERGGFGFLENGRAVLSLDRPNGDAWAAIVDDRNGFAGTASIYDRAVGDNATGIFSGTQGKKAFFNIKDVNDRPREEFEVNADGKPAIRILGENGQIEQYLLKRNSH